MAAAEIDSIEKISALVPHLLDIPQKTIMILRQGSCPKDEKPGES